MSDVVTLADVEAAADRLRGVIRDLTLVQPRWLEEIVGGEVRLVTENLQRAGSFKIRGAYNRIAQLTEEEKDRGIVAASAGAISAAAAAMSAAAAGVWRAYW